MWENRDTNVCNDNQINRQCLKLEDDGVLPNIIRNVAVHFAQGDGGRGTRGVASHDKEVIQVKDGGMGSKLGLLDH